MDHLIHLNESGKYIFNTPKNRAKSFANLNFSEILEENYSQMGTKASTGAKLQAPITNFINIKTNTEESYEGETDENYNRCGYGIYHYANGDVYEGDFINGMRDGIGEYIYIDGCVYKGEWIEDKKEGRGVIKINNVEYAGEWRDDRLVSGLKYETNIYKKNNFEYDIDYNNFDTKSHKEIYYDSCQNIGKLVSKFELKSCELDDDYMGDGWKAIQDMHKEWKTLTESDYVVDVSLDMMQKKKKIKFNAKDSTDSTNSHLSELSDLGANPALNRLGLCYFHYFSKVSCGENEDINRINMLTTKSGDEKCLKQSKVGSNFNSECGCEKFISQIIKA